MFGLPVLCILPAFTMATSNFTVWKLSLYFLWTSDHILNYCCILWKFRAFVVNVLCPYKTIQSENPVNHKHSRMLAIFAQQKFFRHVTTPT